MSYQRLMAAMAVAGVMAIGVSSASAAFLLNDQFDDGVLGTNTTGVGSGFTLFTGFGSGSTAVESGGTVNIKSNGTDIVPSIQSNDVFDPTGLTLTWGIESAVTVGFDGVGVGWVQPGVIPGQPKSVILDMRSDRLTFDLLDGSGNFTRQLEIALGSNAANATFDWDYASPLVAEIMLDATGWAVKVTGTNVSVDQSGLYSDLGLGGWQVSGTDRVTLAMIQADIGAAEMATAAYTYREPGDAVFSFVTIIPEPASLVLMGIGGLLMLRRRRA